jgi:MFS family permease
MAVVAPFAGRLSDRFPAAGIAVCGGVVVALALTLLLFTGLGGNVAMIAVGLGCLGVGMSLFSTPNQNATLAAVPEGRIGVVGALSNQARTLGNVFGVGVSLLALAIFVGDAEVTASTAPGLRAAVRLTLMTGIGTALFAIAYSMLRRRRRGGEHRKAPPGAPR